MNYDSKIIVTLQAIDKMSAVIKSSTSGSIKKLNEFSAKANNVANKAFDTGKSAGAIGLAIAAPLGLAVKAAADYEKMQVSLNTAFQGNEKAAQQAFKTINKFAGQTPYELNEVMTGFIKLKNMGLDPSTTALTAYGNTASSMGKSLNDMIEAVADAATGEFERLKEFGIKAKSQGDKVTFTFQGVQTTIGKNSKEIENYLKTIGNTKFAGGIEKQSKTIAGQFSTLKDNAMMIAVKMGNTLIPTINKLFKAVMPVIDRITAWIDANPELTQQIMMVAAGAAGLALTISGLSFVIGGIAKAISGVAMALKFLAANPWVIAIAAIAAGAYLIYKNWDKIKQFFINMWIRIKEAFWVAVKWIKEWGPLFLGPIGFIYKLFTSEKFREAGKKLIISIWEGMKAFVNKPVETIRNMVAKIRDYLPFSPAKVGALRDIHRIKLVETIAASVKPAPLVNAMRATTAAAMIAATPISAKSISNNSSSKHSAVSVNYNPVIHVNGGTPTAKEDFKKMLKEHEGDLMRLIEEANRKSNRTKL